VPAVAALLPLTEEPVVVPVLPLTEELVVVDVLAILVLVAASRQEVEVEAPVVVLVAPRAAVLVVAPVLAVVDVVMPGVVMEDVVDVVCAATRPVTRRRRPRRTPRARPAAGRASSRSPLPSLARPARRAGGQTRAVPALRVPLGGDAPWVVTRAWRRLDHSYVTDPTLAYDVLASDEGNIRVLTLNRPSKLNAFTPDGYRVLRGRLDDAAVDDAVSVCVLTGAGRAFSSGVDLSVVSRPNGASELGAEFDPLMERLATFPKPLIAAVNGLAVGFGATILLHCDMVIVDERAELRMPFARLGTTAEAASSWLLPQRVGMQQAAWLVFSGAGMDAEAAVATGFALCTAPPGQALAVALERARVLAAHRLPALLANKALLREGWAQQARQVWEREKAEARRLAEELGPIGSG
jgi:enoyl-CoA hydratase/carnithine racemase